MWYRFFRLVVCFLAFCLCHAKVVSGKENLNSITKERAIIIANHTYWNDPMIVAACIRKKIYIMAKEELFHNRIAAWALGKFCVFPIRRGAPDISAIKQALRILRENYALLIFPEGTRSQDGELLPFYDGPAMLALKTGAPVLIIYIEPYRIFKKVRVHIDDPLDLMIELPSELEGQERVAAANKLMQMRMQALKDSTKS